MCVCVCVCVCVGVVGVERERERLHENESKSVSEGGRKLALAILYRAQEYSGSEEWKQLRCSIDQDLLVLM